MVFVVVATTSTTTNGTRVPHEVLAEVGSECI